MARIKKSRMKRNEENAKLSASARAEGGGELVEMDEAIRMLKTTRPTFYRWLRAGKVRGMKLGRQWRFYREELDRFLKGEAPRIELRADIQPLITTLRKRVEELGGKDPTPSNANDVERGVWLTVRLAVAISATDIHIEPHPVEGTQRSVAKLRFRVDGVLCPGAEIDMRLLPPIIAQWKTMAACNPDEKRRVQDGRILLKLPDCNRSVDMRVCFLPAVLGESLTIRLIDADARGLLKLDEVAYSPRDEEKLLRWLHAPWGLIAVCGPTPSGRATTLYACMNHLADPKTKIIAIENPVFTLMPGVLQVEVNANAGMTSAAALRGALRSSSNVIIVRAIRDFETMMIAQVAATEGRLVIVSLSSNDAASALKWMAEAAGTAFLTSDAVKLVIAQRLIRKLCPHCRRKEIPLPSYLEDAAATARAGGVDWERQPKDFLGPAGCARCGQTGFKGQTVIAEALEVTEEIRETLRRNASADEMRGIAVKQGMTTFPADGLRRSAAGETSLEEVLRVVGVR